MWREYVQTYTICGMAVKTGRMVVSSGMRRVESQIWPCTFLDDSAQPQLTEPIHDEIFAQMIAFWLVAASSVAAMRIPAPRAWEPAKGPLATRWAKDVSPERVWPEYPRPQMVREKWVNLNGLWSYAIRPAAEAQPTKWDGEILVPFAVESALSGVKKAVAAGGAAVVSANIRVADADGGQRLLAPLRRRRLEVHGVGQRPNRLASTRAVTIRSRSISPTSLEVGRERMVVAVSDPTDTGYSAARQAGAQAARASCTRR